MYDGRPSGCWLEVSIRVQVDPGNFVVVSSALEHSYNHTTLVSHAPRERRRAGKQKRLCTGNRGKIHGRNLNTDSAFCSHGITLVGPHRPHSSHNRRSRSEKVGAYNSRFRGDPTITEEGTLCGDVVIGLVLGFRARTVKKTVGQVLVDHTDKSQPQSLLFVLCLKFPLPEGSHCWVAPRDFPWCLMSFSLCAMVLHETPWNS